MFPPFVSNPRMYNKHFDIILIKAIESMGNIKEICPNGVRLPGGYSITNKYNKKIDNISDIIKPNRDFDLKILAGIEKLDRVYKIFPTGVILPGGTIITGTGQTGTTPKFPFVPSDYSL